MRINQAAGPPGAWMERACVRARVRGVIIGLGGEPPQRDGGDHRRNG